MPCDECEQQQADMASITNKPWDGSAGRFNDQQYKNAAAACDTGAGNTVKQQCFLPHHEPDGTLNSNGVHAAAQRVSSVKGYSAAAVGRAKAHLRGHYNNDLKEDVPDSLKATTEEITAMAYEQGQRGEVLTMEADGITAAAGDAPPSDWHAILCVEGLRTADHRLIAQGALVWRQLPLALMAQFTNDGHTGADIVGSITSISRDEATGQILASGTFNLALEAGVQAAQMCADQTLRWVSVDMDAAETQYVEIGGSGGEGDLLDILFGDPEADGPDDYYTEFVSARIMGATMVPFPAFPQAVIAPAGVALDPPEPMGEGPQVHEGQVASATIKPPVQPPASWFDDPKLDVPTPWTITDEGRVYGHLALWGSCHVGMQGKCTLAPHSSTDYAYFKTGSIECEGGERINCGVVSFNTSHAITTTGWHEATAHYDHTGCVGADVNVGEDEHGIWVSGALRSNLSAEDIRAMRAAPLSGDWRVIRGGRAMELIAALAVNVPGYPIVASAGMVDDKQVSLIAAGVRKQDAGRVMARQLAELRHAILPLLPLVREQLAARVGPKPVPDNIIQLRERVNGGRQQDG